SEVEAVLLRQPGVAEVSVVGAPHEVWGERVVAVVVPSPGAPADDAHARALIRACRAELATYKCPTQVDWRAELPRNAAGKIAKPVLRAPYWAGRERKV